MADSYQNRVLPEREDTNHEDTLLTLLLNKKLAWRRPENIDWELAKKFEELEQLEKLKDQLSAEEGSEVAYALESLSASQPKKRGKFWATALSMGLAQLQPSHSGLMSRASFLPQDGDGKHAPDRLRTAFPSMPSLSCCWVSQHRPRPRCGHLGPQPPFRG
uniref:Urotensin 2B n=1 Tax=Anas platyrhynchos platyrhynchos TaxID=8840 RepID=A0A493SUG8_ANAPP